MMGLNELEKLKKEIQLKAKNGIDFIVSAAIVWFGVFLIWTTSYTSLNKSIITFIFGSVLLPLAIGLSRFFKTQWRIKDNPLQPLGLWLNFAQLIYFPFLVFILIKYPDYFIMAYAIITGAHLFPYAWFYDSMGYAVASVTISVGSLLLALNIQVHEMSYIPLFAFVVLSLLAIWSHYDYIKVKIRIPLIALILLSIPALGQESNHYSDNPLDAQFITEDVDRFWQAFERMDEQGSQAFEEYINKGTPGLQGFIPYRIINADSLFNMVKRNQEAYMKSKNALKDLESKEKRIKSIYAALKYWYPESVFPPVYFVVGRFNSGGTISDAGIILGAEMQKDLEGLPGLVAHELIHYQQKNEFTKTNILSQSLKEGTADFIGELISGENINSKAYQYGEKHQGELKKEFVEVMDSEDFTDWLYGTSGKDNRPNDLGYWMGYEIVKSYFDKQADKKKAIHDILYISNPYDFLVESGFLSTEIENRAKEAGLTSVQYIELIKNK